MAGEVDAYLEAQTALQRHAEHIQQVLRPIHAFSEAAARGGWKRIRIPDQQMPSELMVP